MILRSLFIFAGRGRVLGKDTQRRGLWRPVFDRCFTWNKKGSSPVSTFLREIPGLRRPVSPNRRPDFLEQSGRPPLRAFPLLSWFTVIALRSATSGPTERWLARLGMYVGLRWYRPVLGGSAGIDCVAASNRRSSSAKVDSLEYAQATMLERSISVDKVQVPKHVGVSAHALGFVGDYEALFGFSMLACRSRARCAGLPSIVCAGFRLARTRRLQCSTWNGANIV